MILQAHMLVLVLEVVFDVLFSVLLKGLDPMKVVRPLTTSHRDLEITTSVDNPNRILVCLSIISNESLELRQRNSMLRYDVVKILLKDNLSVFVLRLEILLIVACSVRSMCSSISTSIFY